MGWEEGDGSKALIPQKRMVMTQSPLYKVGHTHRPACCNAVSNLPGKLHWARVKIPQEHLSDDTWAHEVHKVDKGPGHLRAKLEMKEAPGAPEKLGMGQRVLQNSCLGGPTSGISGSLLQDDAEELRGHEAHNSRVKGDATDTGYRVSGTFWRQTINARSALGHVKIPAHRPHLW